MALIYDSIRQWYMFKEYLFLIILQTLLNINQYNQLCISFAYALMLELST